MPSHGRKPSNPAKVPSQHGRKPPPPPARKGRNMGKSSSSATAPALAFSILAFIALPAGLVLGVAVFFLHANGVI